MKTIFALIALTLSLNSFAGQVPATSDEQVQNWSMVDTVVQLRTKASGAKLFSVSGGDAAMNGSRLFIAVYASPQDGYKVFEIANVRDWKHSTPDRIKSHVMVELAIDTMDDKGAIKVVRKIMTIDLKNAITNNTVEVKE